MSLRFKASLFVVVTIAAILGTVQLLHAQTSLERFRSIEEDQVVADLQRIEGQIEFSIADVSGTTADWSYWQDSYQYVLDGNSDFEEANLYAEAFSPIDIDLVAYATTQGELRHSTWYQDDGPAPIPSDIASMLGAGASLSVTEPGETHSGLVVADGHVFLVSARGITAGVEDGAPAGTLLMGREVGSAFIATLIEITNLDIAVVSCGERLCEPVGQQPVRRAAEQVVSQTTIGDIEGAAGLEVTVRQDRATYREGLAGIKRVFTITAVIGALAMAFSVMLVRRTIGRLERLNNTAKRVSRSHDHTVRVTPEGRDEIGSLAIGINHMLDGLQSANEAKTKFLSRVSHEVNNPLNGIAGHAQLLELDDLNEDQADCVRNILRGTRHIEQLMAQFLDTARIEAGMISLRIEPLLVDELVREVLALAKPLARSKSITGTYRQASEPVFVFADATRLRQVLLNLVSNAMKYNKEGGDVRVATKVDGTTVRISVTDTGAGLSRAHLERLFVPFDRLDADRGVQSGTGIGLAVSQQLVQQMGGQLTVQSEIGLGSSFTIELPWAAVEERSLDRPDTRGESDVEQHVPATA